MGGEGEVVTNAEIMGAVQRLETEVRDLRRTVESAADRERGMIDRVARVEGRQTAMGRLTVGISAVLSAGAALFGVRQ